MATIPSMTIGTVQVNNVKVIVQDLGKDPLLAGLLGMNFFKDMDLTIQTKSSSSTSAKRTRAYWLKVTPID